MREKPTPRRPGTADQQNMLDKVIAYVSPKTAARRLMARTALRSVGAYSGAGGGYLGARRDRAATTAWNPAAGSPTTDIIPDLPALRSRSRDHCSCWERTASKAGPCMRKKLANDSTLTGAAPCNSGMLCRDCHVPKACWLQAQAEAHAHKPHHTTARRAMFCQERRSAKLCFSGTIDCPLVFNG